jgi:rod shape-determining protein MreC
MLKRPQYIVLGLVVLLALVVLNLPARTATRLKLAVGGLFLPLFGLAGAGQQTAVRATDAVVSRAELARQNESLRRENQQLRLQTMQAEETARENARLRQLFQWQQQSYSKSRLKLARVVLRDPANWWRTVQIDLGSKHGLTNNLPVLTTDGLAGRISSVSLTHAQVVLIGDPNCKVSALVQNETRDTGVIGASDPLDSSLVELSHLSRTANLKPGQNVVTSGLGGIFPAGIPIGKIVDSHTVEYGLYMEARVKLNVNPGALEEVWVLLP